MTLTITEVVANMMATLQKPYWVSRDTLPGLDFSRDIIEPMTNPDFPDGALGIRADDDFWAIAALPYALIYLPFEDIVNAIWPEYKDQITICPDSGSVEQRIYFLEARNKQLEESVDFLNKSVRAHQTELKRLRAVRPQLHEWNDTRHKAESNYFIRQYEHLLIASAHKAEPYAEEHRRGICSKCGLYKFDRVHEKRYIDLHNAGYEPAIKHLTAYPGGFYENVGDGVDEYGFYSAEED